MAANISDLDLEAVREHYLTRRRAHERLRDLFDAGEVHAYAHLALGISDPAGNYSAAEHGMGPVILAKASEQDIFDLATAIEACPNVNHLPRVIYDRAIHGIKISIGSEIAMMLQPKRYWVGNVRTVWSHLVIKHHMNERRANEELYLYYDGERESEMTYAVWRDVYLRMEPDIRTLSQVAAQAARAQGILPGRLRYMWPDAVASRLFERFASTRARAR
jgi:hypothetical protein